MDSEELVRPLSGADWWKVAASGEVPALKVTDGPAGPGASASSAARRRCRPRAPPPSGATWDPDLVRRVGQALAEENGQRGPRVPGLHREPPALAPGRAPLRVPVRGPGAERPPAVAYVGGCRPAGPRA